MKRALILFLLVLAGCGESPSAIKNGDEILVRRMEGMAYVYDRYCVIDIQGDKVQFAGNPRYFPLSEMTWQKVQKPEAE